MAQPILKIENLTTAFSTPEGTVRAVNDFSLDIFSGETVGIVGESGSGKSQTFLSVLGLIASNGKSTGKVCFQGQDLIQLTQKELNKIRGDRISMIFQDPMTCLNPYMRISEQLTEVLVVHQGMSEKEAQAEAIRSLEMVCIPEAKKRFHLYPHEFSGGMRQRVMIAMALLCKPDLLIADEPTTALDVTVQAQILDLMVDLKKELNTSIVFITHDLGVVAGLCDRVVVMYAGRMIENAPVHDLFESPQHPYTKGLLNSTPRLDEETHDMLITIPGQPPNLQRMPSGCSFHPRCEHAMDVCVSERPLLEKVNSEREKACHLPKL